VCSRCEEKNIMANEITGFGGLIFFSHLVILGELRVKYVIRLGRFVKILEDQWKW
jgi:hypothetical protein